MADKELDAAAKTLSECMDYPWEHMPEQGREAMRQHAAKVAAPMLAAERKKNLGALQACLDGAVMSKYASKAECEAARSALRNAMLDVWGA